MSQKSKKGKANGFLMFWLDYRRRHSSQGNEMEMMQSQQEAGRLWDQMPPEERSKYSSNCSNSNSQPKPSAQKKYTSFGISFDELDRQKREEKEKTRAMELTIEQILSTALETNTLDMMTFFFLSTTAFVETLGGEVYPAELAMCKFSLIDGVFDSFNILINPGALPLGMAADAVTHAGKTHMRDLPPNTDGEKSYEVIFQKIISFMGIEDYGNIKKSVPPIYAESGMKDEEFVRAKATLEKIACEAGQENKFRVFSLESLLFRLNKKCTKRRNEATGSDDKPFSSIVITKDMLARDKFMYASIGCEHHNEKDSDMKCCLSKVKRFGYSFVTYCLAEDDEDLVAGFHYPVEAQAIGTDESQFLLDKDWESQVTESFHNIRINSGTLVSERSSLSLPSSGSAASFKSSAANRLQSDAQSSGSKTIKAIPSVPSIPSSVGLGSHASITEMMIGRGGKRGARGAKRF